MKKKVQELIKHPLISGSIVIFSGTLLANVLNFLFNLFVIKNLTKVDYGILQSLISVITLPNMAASSIIPLIVSFGGGYFAKKEFAKIQGLYRQVGTFFFFTGLLLFVIFLFFIPQISQFFHIKNYFLLILTDVILFLVFISVINNALLQAKLAFNYFTFITFMTALLKLLFGVLFVLLGYAVSGAVGALLVSFLLGYLLTFYPLKFLFVKGQKIEKINTRDLLAYGIPSAITILALSSLISTDILLTKHFFKPDMAGDYAGLSLIGRVIFFFTAPIGTVMFPLIVQSYNKKENFTSTFKLSILLVSLPSIVLAIFYYLFPQIVIPIFAKKEYLSIAQYLGFFALFITLYAVVSLLINFYLAIKKTIIALPTVIVALVQAILIWFYHASIVQVIQISFFSTFLLLVMLLLYYPYATKK